MGHGIGFGGVGGHSTILFLILILLVYGSGGHGFYNE